MATTGTAIWPGATTLPGAGTVPGQGLFPYARCRISYDDVSVSNPNWNEVTNVDFRAFTSSRGRDQEHSEFDAGSATASFDNRDRAFDPLFNSSIRPMNRIWLYYEFSGLVKDIFKGYVSAWAQDWPGGGWSDAVATASAADEFSVLSQAALPVTNPPRDTYADLIAADGPFGYWDMNEDPATRQRQPTDIPTPAPDNPVIGLRRADRRKAPSRPRKR